MTQCDEASRPAAEEDVVSLVDIVATLLRRRRLIIVSTLVALAAAAALIVILPPYKASRTVETRTMEANATVMFNASFKALLNESEASDYLMQSLMNPLSILEALRAAGYVEYEGFNVSDESTTDSALFFVKNRFVGNRRPDGSAFAEEERIYSVKLDKNAIALVFRNGDADKARLFLEKLIEQTGESLMAFVTPYALGKKAAFESLLTYKEPSEVVSVSIVQGYQAYTTAMSYLGGGVSPLTVMQEPFVLAPAESSRESKLGELRKDAVKQGALLVFGVFFLSVLAAFVLQYVENVKADPVSMDKLRKALARR